MLYQQQDIEKNRARAKRECVWTALLALPFFAIFVAGFILRMEILCIAGIFLCCAAVILMADLRIAPVLRYGRFLADVLGGLRRTTAGTLMRLGEEEIYEDGVYFCEVILNIYEDLSSEGERRFLLERAKPRPQVLVGRDVAVVSHGNVVLDMKLLSPEGQEEQA